MKLVALIRTKNSISVLEDSLTKLSMLVDEIILMDNGSTDGTLEVCKKFPKIVKTILRDDTGNFHEGRDMAIMLEEGKKRNPDWMTMAWPDEVFEKNLTRKVLDGYMSSNYDWIGFRCCHFWLNLKYCRFDRGWFLYTLKPQRFIWKNLEGTYFKNEVIHPGNIQGINTPVYISPFRIKHFGYAFRTEALKKVSAYRQVDPKLDRRGHKYNIGDPDSAASKDYIMLYPFIEFSNPFINHIYIVFFDGLCKILLIAAGIKRKFWGGLKIFPGAR